MSVQTIVSRVQMLLEDQEQDWASTDYIIQYLGLHNEDVESLLENLDLSFDTDVIILSGVTAGTSDLSTYQQDGGPLDMMMLPTALEWRNIGEDDTKWRPIGKKDKVLDVQPLVGIASYEWRHGLVYISPSTVDVDLRIRCEDLPALLDSDSSTYVKGMTNVLAYGVAALVSGSRGGPAAESATYFEGKMESALSNVADRMVKDEQRVERVMGGRRQGGRPIWRTPIV